MGKEFDNQAYAKALQQFIIHMEQIHTPQAPEMFQEMAKFARFLRLGCVEITVFDDAGAEQRGRGKKVTLYQQENAAEENPYFRREVLGPGRVIYYHCYPIAGEPEWDEEEKERLVTMVNLLNVFTRRMLTIQMGQYHATHESDFDMYNVAYLLRKIGEYSARGMLGEFAACYFNIKRLSFFNEEFGRERGTQFVKAFLSGLEEKLTDPREFVCRIGGDNFAVLFCKTNMDAVLSHLEGMELDTEMTDGKKIVVSAWAGVWRLPERLENPAEVMDKISFAIRVTKTSQSERAVFFDEQMVERFAEINRIQSLFPDAVRNEEFLVYYQPKVLLKKYELVGAEALCRWRHNGEMILPGNFIPVIEQSNRVCQLDYYMLDHVCRDIRRWLDEGRRVVRVSVNFSRRHFNEPDFLKKIVQTIDRYQVPHKYVEIELTETSTEVKFSELKKLVVGLKQQGIYTSVDDFGSGYSSLNLIRELPWDVLKLDKSFIDYEKQDDGKAQMMFGHIISMAREMGMECVTEGVETAEQVHILKENSCFIAQGFFFDRPLPVEEFEKRLMVHG